MSETTALIQRLRQAGLTQTAISAQTGIPQPRLSRWAAGDTPHSADDALKLKALCEQLAAPDGRVEALPAVGANGGGSDVSHAA